jgi:hypothetical protein
MSYKVFFKEDGPFALVDTLEEAAALLRMGATSRTELIVAGKTSLTEIEAMRAFWKEINHNAKKFLSYLLLRPDGVKGDKLTEEIGLPSDKFGGVLGGASKIANKYGVAWSGILLSELRTEGTQRYRWLEPGPLLLKHKHEVLGAVARTPARVTTMGA